MLRAAAAPPPAVRMRVPLALIALVSWLLAAAAVAQPAGTAPPVAATGPATIPYADAAFGFEIQLPAGWEYDRTRFQEFERSIGLLRGRSPGGQQALQILVFHVPPEMKTGAGPEQVSLPSFEDWVVRFGRSLAEEANAPELKWDAFQAGGRVGALLTYSSKIGATETRTFTLCVPFDAATVWVLVHSGALLSAADGPALRQTFDAMAGSLKISYDPAELEHLAAAFERGRKVLGHLKKSAAALNVDEAPSYYDLSLGGRSIGYLTRALCREDLPVTGPDAPRQVTKPGLRVRERSWRFADDGTVRFSRLDLFCSDDLASELIESELVQIPAPDVRPQQLLIKTDQVVRKDDVLIVSRRTNLDLRLPEPAKPLSTGPVYLSLAWSRLLPLLMADAPQEQHAFAVFSPESRALLSQLVTPLGQRTIDGAAVSAFTVREGLVEPTSTLFADASGRLVRLEAGELLVRRASREEIEQRWGARRDEARKRFRLPAMD